MTRFSASLGARLALPWRMNSTQRKVAAISALAEGRRAATAGGRADGYSRDYRHIGSFHDGLYDRHGWVSPWTIAACDVDSDLMVVGQDWAGDDFLGAAANVEQAAKGERQHLATNDNLKWLVREAFGKDLADVYRTNAFVFVKPGDMGAVLPAKDLQRSIASYTLREIEIVRPKMVICLGAPTINGFRRLHQLPCQRLKDAAYHHAELTVHGAEVFGVPHVGGRGLATTGGPARSLEIWRTLALRLPA